MTVKELIEILEDFDKDMEVKYLSNGEVIQFDSLDVNYEYDDDYSEQFVLIGT